MKDTIITQIAFGIGGIILLMIFNVDGKTVFINHMILSFGWMCRYIQERL